MAGSRGGGRSRESIIAELTDFAQREDATWETGKCAGTMYCGYHSHYDFMALTYTRLVRTPVLTTIHGFSSPRIMHAYQKYRDGNFVSISDSDRAPGLNYLATVYNGIDLSLYPIQERGGGDLVFLAGEIVAVNLEELEDEVPILRPSVQQLGRAGAGGQP